MQTRYTPTQSCDWIPPSEWCDWTPDNVTFRGPKKRNISTTTHFPRHPRFKSITFFRSFTSINQDTQIHTIMLPTQSCDWDYRVMWLDPPSEWCEWTPDNVTFRALKKRNISTTTHFHQILYSECLSLWQWKCSVNITLRSIKNSSAVGDSRLTPIPLISCL